MLIDPASLIGQSLRLRRSAEEDYAVVVGDLIAGRILLKPMAGGGEVWLWSVTGPHVPPQLHPASGDSASLEEAKGAFKAKFMAWRHWAVAQGGDVNWHTAVPRVEP